ncbi:evasin P1074-like [Ixodes scapularis]
MGTYSSRAGNCKSVGQVLGHVVSFKHQGEQARPGEQVTPQELARPEPPELFLMPLRNMEQLSTAQAQLKNFTNRTLPIPVKGTTMAFNVITFLQLAVFVVIILNINLHSVSAGLKESSGPQSSDNSLKAEFCDTNCTVKTDGKWTGCSGDCFCVHIGNKKEGRCMRLDGDYDYSSTGPEE